jgi:hypothetical protein
MMKYLGKTTAKIRDSTSAAKKYLSCICGRKKGIPTVNKSEQVNKSIFFILPLRRNTNTIMRS